MVALVGVGGSFVSLPILDPLAGLAVSGMVLKEGVRISQQALHELIDKKARAAASSTAAARHRLVAHCAAGRRWTTSCSTPSRKLRGKCPRRSLCTTFEDDN